MWLALPLTLSEVCQPFNRARLRRFVERPPHLRGVPTVLPLLSFDADWGKHCGKHIDKVSARDLAEFCVDQELELTLPADYYPADHPVFLFDGPRRVRVYDTFYDRKTPLEVAVYLLDLPMATNKDNLDFETCMPAIVSPKHSRAKDCSFIRALKESFPGVTYLKDWFPNASGTVVYRNTLLPIHEVVADRWSGRAVPTRQLLVQFSKEDYENSAWIHDKFVPQRYVDEFWQRVEPEGPPAPLHDQGPQGTWPVGTRVDTSTLPGAR